MLCHALYFILHAGTHNLVVERNVIYNVMGGAIFIEDGIETKNIIQYNLAVFVKQSTSLLNDDVTPGNVCVNKDAGQSDYSRCLFSQSPKMLITKQLQFFKIAVALSHSEEDLSGYNWIVYQCLVLHYVHAVHILYRLHSHKQRSRLKYAFQ